MRNLKQGLMDHTELTKRGRRLLRSGSFFYFILLCLMCFLPQQPEPGMETPGIQHFGRIVVLLVPLNSVMNLGQITSVLQLIKVILQNIANIFLLSPLVFQLLWLWPWLRSRKRVLCFGFAMSLWIECSQVLLDLLFDANRVFELDDLCQYLRRLSGLSRLSVLQSTIASKKWGNVKSEHFNHFLKFLLTKSEAGAIITSRHQKSRGFSHFQGACGDCEQAVVNLEMG